MNRSPYFPYKSTAASLNRDVRYPVMGKIGSIGIVQTAIVSIPVEELASFGQQVIIEKFTYVGGKRIGDTDAHVLYDSDLNFFKKPRKKHIAPFVDKSFDIFIDATDGSNKAMNYICEKSKALFKVACHKSGSYFDLIVPLSPEKVYELPFELKRIVTNLKRK